MSTEISAQVARQTNAQLQSDENLMGILAIRFRFEGCRPVTFPHDIPPPEHLDITDRCWGQGFREIYAPRSSLNHYLEVMVFAPMGPKVDPDRNSLLAWQAFQGMDWAAHEVRASEVLPAIERHEKNRQHWFFKTAEEILGSPHFSLRDKF